ncbi:hypothetical protein YQE_07590, partial [Dendroctonus ponderosae]
MIKAWTMKSAPTQRSIYWDSERKWTPPKLCSSKPSHTLMLAQWALLASIRPIRSIRAMAHNLCQDKGTDVMIEWDLKAMAASTRLDLNMTILLTVRLKTNSTVLNTEAMERLMTSMGVAGL